ncbi:MAG: OmpH family outer membrane protein [Bacillota bacterium]|nr:OmpH family outer membrane protein [Negativicutes bacterium]
MRKNAKLMMLLGGLLVFALLLGGCAQSGAVGVLDINKVMSESPKVKEYQEQLNQKGQELTKQLDTEKPNITAEQFQTKQEAAYKDFLQMKQELETKIDDSVKQATEQVAKEKKLGTIIYKNGVAYGGTDVTQDVMNKMQ